MSIPRVNSAARPVPVRLCRGHRLFLLPAVRAVESKVYRQTRACVKEKSWRLVVYPTSRCFW